MPRLSVIVIALNQEANIGECLKSVSFADEIVVVDTGSADRTVELARAYTDRVLTAEWQGFGRTKNIALDQARGDWVFSLDTDERVPPALLADVKGRIQAAQTRAVLLVNSELVRLYWDIGQIIDERQRREGWGAAVIPRLARELHNELPELKGFSERNIKSMVAFYREYRDPAAIVQQPVAQLHAHGLYH